jgi:hypothetical protein
VRLSEAEVDGVVANAIAFLKSAREPHALLFMGHDRAPVLRVFRARPRRRPK